VSKRGRDDDLDVEELNVGNWGNPGSEWHTPAGVRIQPPVDMPGGGAAPFTGPPPGPPHATVETWSTSSGRAAERAPRDDSTRSWFQQHTNHLIAAAGGFALLVAVVAVSSDPGAPEAAPTTPPTTVAPSTTEARPVSTAAPRTTTEPPGRGTGGSGDGATDDVDYRFALAATPDGFEANGADVSPGDLDDWMMPAGPTLFAADGTSWQTGPWLTIASGNDQTGIAYMFPFVRPPMSYMVGDVEARTGASVDGVEVTSLRRGANVVEIAARGLDPLATAAVAQALQLTDDGIAIPDAAIPTGLRPRPDIDVTSWDWGWTPGIRANVSYGSIERSAWMSFAVRDREEESGPLTSAPYFLTDVRYLVVGHGSGIAGTYDRPGGDPTQYAIWQTADREYIANATGMDLDELIGYAGQIVQPGDLEWRSGLWDDLREEVQDCCRGGLETPMYSVEVPIASVGDGAWFVNADVQAGSVGWNFTHGGPRGDGFGVSSPLGAPVLRVGSRYGWAGAPAEFPAGAIAIVDRSMVGTVLRLTTTGSQPETIEIRLEPVDGDLLAPYLVGAAVLPWLDGGFVAQLIAPDGQTIAVQTDADFSP
jgi:hypothetical protein